MSYISWYDPKSGCMSNSCDFHDAETAEKMARSSSLLANGWEATIVTYGEGSYKVA